MPSGVRVLVLAAALGCGLLGGVLFAFSAFVMPALRRLPGEQGVAAMQSINVTAMRPAFGIAILGTTVACAAVLVVAFRRWGEPGSVLLLVGAGLFFIGGLLVTGLLNVPMNERLAVLEPATAVANGDWADFLKWWTLANHLRTVGALAASAFLMAAAVRA
jgi:uncharacterized membrane protein